MLAHDCASSACWHYGDKESFVLRARQFIKKGDEITISYVGDDDLFKSTNGNFINRTEQGIIHSKDTSAVAFSATRQIGRVAIQVCVSPLFSQN